jgi:hypothetical protein
MAILVFIRSNLYLMVLSMMMIIIMVMMMMMMTVSSMNIVDLGLTTVT